jgi:hypothetical protein
MSKTTKRSNAAGFMWHLQIFIFCSAKGMCGSCVDPGKIIITAIGPLFRSAARFYGRRTIGIVLSGMLDDGAAGLIAIKKAGGIAMVQDPNDALFPDTPSNALAGAPVGYSIPKNEIPKTIVSLVGKSFPEDRGNPMADEIKKETDIVAMNGDRGRG